MKRNVEGFAIAIVLLVSSIALLGFLFSSATLTIMSRSSSAQERNSTQALLAADSGLQTLRARSSQVEYTSTFSASSFEAWIDDSFGTLNLGDGVSASLDVVDVSTVERTFTVQSTGSAGTAQRVVVQAFEILPPDPIPASVNVPGALTSVGQINTNSNALLVEGRDNLVDDWQYAPVSICDALPGEYVEYDNATYRVEADCSDTGGISLVDVTTGNPPGLAPTTSQDVTHKPIATAEPLTVTTVGGVSTSTVDVTPGARLLFGKGAPITVNGSGLGEVTAVDGNTLTIEWDTPPVFQPEGSVLSRDVPSGVTAALECDIGTNGDTTFPDDCNGDNDLSNLFDMIFGIASPSVLKDYLATIGKVITGDQVDDGPLSEITWVTSPNNNFRDQAGEGILIIENDPEQTIRLNVANEFTGLIYVIGNADLAGNANHEGAVIVDGGLNVTTDVQGTLGINYDPLQLVRVLAGLEFPNPVGGGIGASVANTWRIR